MRRFRLRLAPRGSRFAAQDVRISRSAGMRESDRGNDSVYLFLLFLRSPQSHAAVARAGRQPLTVSRYRQRLHVAFMPAQGLHFAAGFELVYMYGVIGTAGGKPRTVRAEREC